MTQPSHSDQAYTAQLGAVLQARDPEALQAFLIESARRFGDERQVEQISQQPPTQLEMMMHRMIVARPDLAALHAESQQWLDNHGFGAPKPQTKPRRAPGPSSRPHQPKRR